MRLTFPRRPLVLALGLTSTTVAAVFGACTDQYLPLHTTGGGGTTSQTTGTGNGGMGIGGVNFDSPMCNDTCSNDLQSVVDCNGTLVMACPPSQGCANGMCVDDPCMAAQTSKSSYGCDYWALKTVQRPEADGACFVAFVANTWTLPVHLAVTYAGSASGGPAPDGGTTLAVQDFAILASNLTKPFTFYDPVGGLPVGEVAILFLSRKSKGSTVVDCPTPAALDMETGVPIDLNGDTGNGIGAAFHITSDYPVVAYQMTPYGGGQAAFTGASLLLPTSAWDTNYIAVNGYTAAPSADYPAGNPSLDIVAYQDNTMVTLLPKSAIVGNGDGGVPSSAPANVPVTYTLNAGQFLQITQPEELTGSVIQSTQPVGVFGASAGMAVPTQQADIDSAQQQLPPVRALGSEYVAVRYRGRGADIGTPGVDEIVPWRLVGAVNGTKLTWTPSAPPGAPAMINQGDIVEVDTPGPFVVTSDATHPFYMGAYMTGGGTAADGGPGFAGEGDPDWVNVTSPSQFLNHYIFFTDQTYPETDLVLIRSPSKVDGSFADVTLNCAGSATSQMVTGWQPIGAYQYTRVDLSTGNFMSVNGCSNGRQELLSKLPFGVTVWGWGHVSTQTGLVSYAYPAGAGFQPINQIIIPPTPQ